MAGVDEDLAPLRERRVGRDGEALALVALGDQLEQHRGLGLVAPHVAQVVQDEQIEAVELGQLLRPAAGRAAPPAAAARGREQRMNSTRRPASISACPRPHTKWLLPTPGGPNSNTLAPRSSHSVPSASAMTCAFDTLGTAAKSKLDSRLSGLSADSARWRSMRRASRSADLVLEQRLQQPIAGPALAIGLRAQLGGQPLDRGQPQTR